jgi:hypothetical protein
MCMLSFIYTAIALTMLMLSVTDPAILLPMFINVKRILTTDQ